MSTEAPSQTPQAPESNELKSCRFCGEEIRSSAVKCKHCGEFLDEALRQGRANEVVVSLPRWNPGIAALCSFFIPGLGQVYKGQVFNGLVWFLLVLVGYFCFIIPGLILHLFCILGAASGDPRK
jgi:TM2 domain-containing membrane protein YozV